MARMRECWGVALISLGVLGACARDALPAAPEGTADAAGAMGSRDGDVMQADLAVATFDLAPMPCITAGQPADAVTGTILGTQFTARVGVAGWSYGEGGCNGQPTVYLYQGRLPPGSEIEPVPELRFYDGASYYTDLGARRDVDVTFVETINVSRYAHGKVEWLRKDDYMKPGGVLEGNLIVEEPGWNLRGHFIANRCNSLDQLCI